jgi:acyl dehydratase
MSTTSHIEGIFMPVSDRNITDEMLEEAKALIGTPVDRSRQTWNTLASRDAIRHFAWGVGDDNPLWSDPEYAINSVWGKVIAPPTFLYSVDSTVVFPGLEGLARLFAGNDWTFHLPVYEGDVFHTHAEVVGAREVNGRKAGRMIVQVGKTRYFNQRDELIAEALSTCFRTVRATREGGPRYAPRMQNYSRDELEQIRIDSISEVRRGEEPRYWDDVKVGDTIPGVTKGPLNLTDMICWYVGALPHGRRPVEMAWKELSANPDFYYGVPETGAFEFSERGHYDAYMANQVGMPGPYDNGQQRTSWVCHAITNWMGDAGVVKTLESRVLLPNVFGDTLRITGTVAEKWEDDGGSTVRVNLVGMNQLGEKSTSANATVSLPRKQSS